VFLRVTGALVYARHVPGALAVALLGRRLVFEALELPTPSPSLGGTTFTLLTRRRALVRIVVISHALRHAILERWPALAPDSVVVAPDAVDFDAREHAVSAHEARARLRLEKGGRVMVGYVGQLYAGRGIDLILEMAHRLPDTSFLLVGGDPRDVTAVRLAVRKGSLDNVTVVGFIPPAHVWLYMAACDILLMPYQQWVTVAGSGHDTARWMSPLKMFEYLAAERLVVASDIPVLREVLTEDIAVLVDPEDPGAWCDAVQHAADDPAWAQQRALAARGVAAEHTWRARAARCLPSG
jgi:glycosyltransferase involved in cell wall biosynthesis